MSTKNLTEFSNKLKKCREDSNLSKAELSRRVGVSAAYIGQLEGMTDVFQKKPSRILIKELCRELKVNSEWLLYDRGEKNSEYSSAADPPQTKEKLTGYSNQPLKEDELRLIKLYRKLHLAEQEKVIEIAELYNNVKESRENAGGGSDLKESNSK